MQSISQVQTYHVMSVSFFVFYLVKRLTSGKKKYSLSVHSQCQWWYGGIFFFLFLSMCPCDLTIVAPVVVILDENGHSVTERHYKVDSSLHLTCRASHVDKFEDKVVWLKGERALSGTDNRIKIK